MTCDLNDLVDAIDDQIDIALEEGAEAVDIAAAARFSVGRLLTSEMCVQDAMEIFATILNETAPVSVELELTGGTRH